MGKSQHTQNREQSCELPYSGLSTAEHLYCRETEGKRLIWGSQASICFLSFIHDKMEKDLGNLQNCPLGVVQMDGSITPPKHYFMFNINIIEASEVW